LTGKTDENTPKEGSVYNYEILLVRKDKTPVWVSTIPCVSDKDGKFAGVEGKSVTLPR
jgi:hypothetical protein